MKNNKLLIAVLAMTLLFGCLLASCGDDGDTSGSGVSNGVISNGSSSTPQTSSADSSSAQSESSADTSSPGTSSVPDTSGGASQTPNTSSDASGNGSASGNESSNVNVSGLSAYFTPAAVDKEYTMTAEKVSDARYQFTSQILDGQTMTLNLDKKSWGTYILGSWKLDNGGTDIDFTCGSTDMEYVYRAGATADSCDWSGGNHGNESLVSISVFDGITGEEIAFENGVKHESTVIWVVERTRLHWGDASVYYCDVVRTYTLTGPRIELAVDYSYVKDCYFRLSYTCMFPISKAMGQNAAFFSGSELIGAIQTQRIGTPDYKGKMYKGYAADRVIMWGEELPEYKIEACVQTVESSTGNFSNADKTFYWDMNTTHNKLYFSKFSSDTPTLVKAGTKLRTVCSWTMLKDKENINKEGEN